MIPIEDCGPERDLSKLDADKGKDEEQSGMDTCYQEELRRCLASSYSGGQSPDLKGWVD